MIRIITGAVNSGKTSYLQKTAESLPGCTGFLSRKVFSGESCIGYDLHILRTGENLPFIRTLESSDPGEEVEELLGNFCFYRSGFSAARKELDYLAMDASASHIIIDEVGPVELKGGGYLQNVSQLIPLRKDIYLCIRTKILEKVIQKLEIRKYLLINAPVNKERLHV